MTPATELLLPDIKTPDSSNTATQLVAVNIQQPVQQPPSTPAKLASISSVRADEKSGAQKSRFSKKHCLALLFLIVLLTAMAWIISELIGESFQNFSPSPSPFKYMSGQDAFNDMPATRFCLYNPTEDTKTYSGLTATVEGNTENFIVFTGSDSIPITGFSQKPNNSSTLFNIAVTNNSPIPSGAADSILFANQGDYHPWKFTDVTVDGRSCAPVSGDVSIVGSEANTAYYACRFWIKDTPLSHVQQSASASGLAMVAASKPVVDSKLDVSGNKFRFN